MKSHSGGEFSPAPALGAQLVKSPGRPEDREGPVVAPRLLLAVVSVAAAMLGASPSQAQAASYTVRQCDPGYTTDHEFVYPYVARSDAFFDVNKCSQFASLGLHAQPFKTVGTEDGNSYILWRRKARDSRDGRRPSRAEPAAPTGCCSGRAPATTSGARRPGAPCSSATRTGARRRRDNGPAAVPSH